MGKIVEIINEKNGGAPDFMIIDNIEIKSRNNQWEEMESMFAGIKNMPKLFKELIKDIFCDSNSQHCFTIELLHSVDKNTAHAIGLEFERGIMENEKGVKGHNGITVVSENGEVDICPNFEAP